MCFQNFLKNVVNIQVFACRKESRARHKDIVLILTQTNLNALNFTYESIVAFSAYTTFYLLFKERKY